MKTRMYTKTKNCGFGNSEAYRCKNPPGQVDKTFRTFLINTCKELYLLFLVPVQSIWLYIYEIQSNAECKTNTLWKDSDIKTELTSWNDQNNVMNNDG